MGYAEIKYCEMYVGTSRNWGVSSKVCKFFEFLLGNY